jgi:hypothetical protein
MIKITITALALLLAAGPALAGSSCEDVKAGIAKRLDGHGVKTYTLTVVGKNDKTDGKVVGSCAAGAKAIVYKRG